MNEEFEQQNAQGEQPQIQRPNVTRPGEFAHPEPMQPLPEVGGPTLEPPGGIARGGQPQPTAGGAPSNGAPASGAAFGLPSSPAFAPIPPAQPKKKRTPGWGALIAATVVAALVGGGLGYGAVYSQFGKARPAAAIAESASGSTPVVKQTADNAPDWQAVHQAVSPSVVAITNSSQEGTSAGSGVIIDKEGHIVTNNHVIAGAKELLVSLADGRVFKAKLVGTDPATDLAVILLQDPPKDLAFAQIGDSSKVVVGQPVAAIGNPLGLEATMTTGIVSALDRPVTTQGESADPFSQNQASPVVTNAIQIDAAVNPGNSGGPVFDAQGRVVGIASSIASIGQARGQQAGSIGLGFAIPVNLAKNVADQLIKNGVAEHAFLGVTISDGVAQFNGQARIGAQVQSVTPGTPAAKAGIRSGDVITKIDGHNVSGGTSLTGYVRQYKSGDVVTVTFDRDGKLLDVDVTLATRKDAK
ncbi:putative serine protease PepD [Arcanobacterium wilhelmae]|uniref:Serine protease PepD n=1 Tax=Arcanobacterium wilhelmae TaxID=1803177 RepID=A0ABT9NA16_9ACTO|nr:trypsin-like peptidase domain-containing protein [Arcanobacterium wilhelmae]MDP9800562.1 putative serine protease PepD [Arcanobacterium wilhelmae]WFN89976.1 trypsin-like peptidase domain-containing protein [Arcanobacterium wilhelmae]